MTARIICEVRLRPFAPADLHRRAPAVRGPAEAGTPEASRPRRAAAPRLDRVPRVAEGHRL